MKKKVCAYCRVSTTNSSQESSYENQVQYFKSVLSEYDLVEVYADKETGTTFDREGLLRMVNDAGVDVNKVNGKLVFTASKREPKFEEIYVSNTSRIARNVLIIDIIRELRKKQVYINFMDWGKTTRDDSIDLTLTIFLGIDEQTSRDMSSKIRNGNKKKAMTTDKLFATRLYGYKYENEVFKIIPHEAEIVRKIFNLVEQGYGRRVICRMLAEEGIVRRDGKPFAISNLKNMLHNIKYTGVNDKLKWKITDKFSGSKVSKNEDVILEKSKRIPAIITRSQFDRVQRLMEERTTEETKGRKIGVHSSRINEYGSKIRCATCGNQYNRCKDKQYLYYICSHKKKVNVAKCSNPNISSVILESFIEESVKCFKERLREFLYESKRRLVFLIPEVEKQMSGDNIETKLTEINEKIEKLQDKELNLLDRALTGAFSQDVIDRMTSKIALEKEELLKQKEYYKDIERQIFLVKEKLGYQFDFMKHIYSREKFTKEDIIELAREIIVHPDKSLEIKYHHEEEFLRLYSETKTYDPTDFKI